MTSIPLRIKQAYESNSLGYLIKKGPGYITRKLVWSILPKNKTYRVVSRSRILTSLYFSLTGRFYREQSSLLCGFAKYHEKEQISASPKHRVIRNTHRIEKGISMKNRRKVFAEGYIQDLVNDLRIAWEQREDEQLTWTVDVLEKYFSIVNETEVITEAKKDFHSLLSEIEYEPQNQVPFPRRELENPPVGYEELHNLAKNRTSTRWFTEEDVSRKDIDEALKIAMQSPSACNRQSFEFLFFDDSKLIEGISSLAIGATGYNDNIPCLAVIVGRQRAYRKVRDKHVVYIDASLAAMAFQFALETKGLASCCINWPSIPEKERKMSEKLDLDCDEEVIMLMAIGYPDPDGKIPYSKKKSVEEVRSFNESNAGNTE